MRLGRREFLGGLAGAAGGMAAGMAAGGCDLAVFRAHVTPPLGEPLVCGFVAPTATIEHPLSAKGVILRDGGGVCVLCALDWEVLIGDPYDLFRERLARAAGTTASRVAIQCLHLHTAPGIDSNVVKILGREQKPPAHATLAFLEQAVERTTAAVRQAAARFQPVTEIGAGWAPVDRVASSRRVLRPDGAIVARMSKTADLELRKEPEGLIDGFLRTISFFSDGRPLARLHYYATHPQSYYYDGRVTYDVPGLARERLEKESGVFQVYFTGCAGNVTMGKYNDGTPAGRQALADRVYDGMAASIQKTRRAPVTPLVWKTAAVRFPLRAEKDFSEEYRRAVLRDPAKPPVDRIKAAMVLSFIERVRAGRPIEISCLHLGDVRVVHLPGEPFVEYQLWAQENAAGRFVAVAGYGDGGPSYICTDRAYQDRGGYEQTWSLVGPSEQLLKRAIAQVL